MKTTKQKQIADLEAEVRKHLLFYHDLHTPVISDQEFDKLYDKLRDLAPDSTVLNERGQFDGDFKHSVPMGSLPKVKMAADLYKKFAGKVVTCTPKIDGAGLANHYRASRLFAAATRGKTATQKGKNVTVVIPAIPSIPLSVSTDDDFEARGEVVILKSDWESLKISQPDLANARNAASGGLQNRDITAVKNRKLTFMAYKVVKANPSGTHAETLEFLAREGFVILPYEVIEMSSLQVAQELIARWDEKRKSLPYETDGIVIRLNDEKAFSDAGMSGVDWNGGAAFKYESEKATSVVKSIERNATRTGRIVPVLNIHPTEICGSVVERITLNNEQWLRDKDVAVGDTIEFQKANEVIPNFVGVVSRPTNREPSPTPTTCPTCGGEVAEKGKGGDIECLSDECPAKFIKHIRRILEVFEAKGIDETTIEKMDEAGLLPEVWSIFDITQSDLVKAGFGNRESEIMVKAVSNLEAKATYIVSAVGIPLWGRRMLELLQNASPEVFTDDKLLAGDFKYDELISTKGVGPEKAKVLSEAFGVEGRGKTILAELLKRVKPTKPVGDITNKVGGKLTGKTFLITGTLSQPRKHFETLVVENGGKLASGVSKALSYLIVGEDAGSKLSKAQAAGVKIINEEELLGMLHSTP